MNSLFKKSLAVLLAVASITLPTSGCSLFGSKKTVNINNFNNFPLTFTYDGKEYSGFKGFTKVSQEETEITNGTETTTILTTDEINADFKVVTRDYPSENAYEFVVYIENNSDKNTGVFEDVEFEIEFNGKNGTLSGLSGDGGDSWYKEYEKDLTEETNVEFKSTSGRPTHHVFPYYNLSYGSDDNSNGTFIAVGWSGTWHANFTTVKNTITLTTGQNNVQTYIEPGETFRTPLIALVEYSNTSEDEQTNVWRHYYLNDVMPKTEDGSMISTMAGASKMANGATEKQIMSLLKKYIAAGIPLEVYWMDAGWYTGAEGETVDWPSTGTQEIDTSRFPSSLSDIGEYCEENDMDYLVWFEPESFRINKETYMANNPEFKSEWLLSKANVGTWLEGYIFNMGNEEAVDWLIEKVSAVIESSGLTIYRQDFNCDPAEAWTINDLNNRKGMTENQYVQGYLRYWDTLKEKYPYLTIDSCASGGGRNDLETMKRAVPLHYSDLFDGSGDTNNTDKTRMTQSLFAWFPYFKNESYSVSKFTTRINYASFSLLNMPDAYAKGADWETLKNAYSEYAQIKNYFYDDYYQLTEYSEEEDRWNGWEFFNKDTGEGFAEVICNTDCTNLTNVFKLKGLDSGTTYNITDLDGTYSCTKTGNELMNDGISITAESGGYAGILLISKA